MLQNMQQLVFAKPTYPDLFGLLYSVFPRYYILLILQLILQDKDL